MRTKCYIKYINSELHTLFYDLNIDDIEEAFEMQYD